MSNIVPDNGAVSFIALYFRRKRLVSLGIKEKVSKFEIEVLLYIDSQIDSFRAKLKK